MLVVMGGWGVTVRSVEICLLGSRILVKTILACWGGGSTGVCLVDCIFLLAWCMCPLAVSSYG